MNRRITLALAAVLLPQAALAQGVGARERAMGGTGVASAKCTSAPFTNPALARRDRPLVQFAMIAPFFGFAVGDEHDLLGEVEGVQDSLDSLQTALQTGAPNTPELRAAAASDLAALEDRTLFLDAGLAASGILPTDNVTFALGIRRHFDMHAFALVDAADLATIATSTDPNALDALGSEVIAAAATVTEIGLTAATDFDLLGRPVYVGFTTKYQSVETYNYATGVREFDESDLFNHFDDEEYATTTSAANVDLGLAVEVTGDVTVGLAVMNLIEQTFDSVERGGRRLDYEVEPLPTLGVAYARDRWTFALDVDLASTTRYDVVAPSQWLRIGAEYAQPTWIDVRAGYQHDIDDAQQDFFTLGLGFDVYGGHVFDTFFALGERGVGAGFELQWRF